MISYVDKCVCGDNFWNADSNCIYSINVQASEETINKGNSTLGKHRENITEYIQFNDSSEEAKSYYMPNKKEITSKLSKVSELLGLFFLPTPIENYRCDYCHKRTTCIQQFYIKDPPAFLILNLKRYNLFSNPVTKIKANILNEINLDIKNFVISTQENVASCGYELYAVIEHRGSLESGHYKAFIKSSIEKTSNDTNENNIEPENLWFLADDSKIRKVKAEVVEKCEGFLLFYEKKRPLKTFT